MTFLFPDPAFAFSQTWLGDPGFLFFILLELPLASSLLMAFFIGTVLHCTLPKRPLPYAGLVLTLFRALLFSFIVNLLVIIIIVVVTYELLEDPRYEIVRLGAIIYFALFLCYNAWSLTWKRVKLIYAESVPRGKLIPALLIPLILSYLALYAYVYYWVR